MMISELLSPVAQFVPLPSDLRYRQGQDEGEGMLYQRGA